MADSRSVQAIEEKVSYIKEMLTHKYNVYGFLGALAAGAVLSLPLGFGVGALPVVAYLAGAAIAALFVPSMPNFRDKVDTRKRTERREASREHLMHEINMRVGQDHNNWRAYWRMRERVETLGKTATNRQTALKMRDVERMDDATVDFLGLWLAGLAIYDRQRSMDERKIRYKLEEVESRIKEASTSADRRRLEKAKADLENILRRREQLSSREASIEAAMLNMADTFDEVYQGVMANPNSGDVTQQLQNAVERMHVQEDLGSVIDDDINEMFAVRRGAQAAKSKSM